MAIKSISSAFHVSRNTVRKYVRRYQESGLTLEQLMTMSEEKLQEMFFDDRNRSRKPTPRKEELEAASLAVEVEAVSDKGHRPFLFSAEQPSTLELPAMLLFVTNSVYNTVSEMRFPNPEKIRKSVESCTSACPFSIFEI